MRAALAAMPVSPHRAVICLSARTSVRPSVCRCSLWFLGVRFSSPLWLSCSNVGSVPRRRTGQNLEEEVVHPHRQLPLLLRVHHGEYRSGCHGNPATLPALSRCSRIYPGQRAQGDHPTGEPEHQRGGG